MRCRHRLCKFQSIKHLSVPSLSFTIPERSSAELFFSRIYIDVHMLDINSSLCCRISIGSLDAMDIPHRRPRHSLGAFGSADDMSPLPEPSAITFDSASFSWQTTGASHFDLTSDSTDYRGTNSESQNSEDSRLLQQTENGNWETSIAVRDAQEGCGNLGTIGAGIVLRDINIAIPEGKFVVVQGAVGSGKTIAIAILF